MAGTPWSQPAENKRQLELMRVFGIPIFVDFSWLFIASLITWSLATGPFRTAHPDAPAILHWAMGVAGALGLFASVLLHELGHSAVALRYGVRIKGITLWLFGGVAQMENEPPSAKAEFWIAIAGPAVSFLLGVLGWGLVAVAQLAGLEGSPLTVLSYLAGLNLILGTFNLIPAFPLDGGRVLRAALWAQRKDLVSATRSAARAGSLFGAGLMGLGLYSVLVAGDLFGGVWIGIIGLFVRQAANGSYQSTLIRHLMGDVPLQRLMTRDLVLASPDLSVEQVVSEIVFRHHHKLLPVVDEGGDLLGSVSLKDLASVPKPERSGRVVASVMRPLDMRTAIDVYKDALETLSVMQEHSVSRLLVTEGSALVGIITLKDLMTTMELMVLADPPEGAPVAAAKENARAAA